MISLSFRTRGKRVRLLPLFLWIILVSPLKATDGSLLEQLGSLVDIVVAQDGSGDYTTVQEAIDAAPDSSDTRIVIFIRNGIYHEKLIVPNEKPNLTFVGEHADSTILTYNDRSMLTLELNTFTSHSVRVDASDVTFMNLTIQNPETASQAVALHGNGDRQTFAHCRILGWQDTYYSEMRSRNYFKDCFIEGRTDFIFGFGVALFDSCQIYSVQGGYATAASTPRYYDFGMVFRNCRFNSAVNSGGYFLGRPWFDYARTVLLNCYESETLTAAGWKPWNGREATCYYREYNCFGPGSDTSGRVDWSHQLSDQEAEACTLENIFSADNFPPGDDDYLIYWETRFKDHQTEPYLEDIVFRADGDWPVKPDSDWVPGIDSDSVYGILRVNTTLFLDSINLDARIGSLKVGGEELPDWDPGVFEYFVDLAEGTTEVPEIQATAVNPLASIEIDYPDALPGFAVVTILANDRASHQTYSLYLSSGGASDNAFLDSIRVGGILIGDFDPEVYEYEVILPQGTTKYYPVNAYAQTPDAKVSITKPGSLPGTIIILVTAVDGSTKTYSVNASIATGLDTGKESPPAVWFNPGSPESRICIRLAEPSSGPVCVELFDVRGRLLAGRTWESLSAGDHSIALPGCSPEICFYRIFMADQRFNGKLLLHRNP